MAKPPQGVDDIFAATMVLLAGVHPNVIVQKNGKVKDKSWDACKRQLLGSIPEYMEYLKNIKTGEGSAFTLFQVYVIYRR